MLQKKEAISLLTSLGSFWKQHRSALYGATLLFLAGIILAFIFFEPLQAILQQTIENLIQKILPEDTGTVDSLTLFRAIFLNNLQAALITLFSGFLFGIFPVFTMLLNGLAVGYTLKIAAMNGANILLLLSFGILPHGIFEIPALILSAAYGFVLGALVIQSVARLFSRTGERTLGWSSTMRALLPNVVLITVLLLIAAAIESTATMWLVQTFVHTP
ncbi:MAG: hypothetical protein BSOLF_2661 [Candidatus Carbobacillus altaicus]|uniref:Stage II sporulation protein M n=1 Tax=Candidatus Carbonibacillus altaicus TaxID=2163959 RepID=A0A2R6Y297_9BACL|nr:MAG: hypothetical protein BSOLF_2661 [Candidatus Carbobacillus altaicus]